MVNADNLAANYSRELADYIIYVIDVAGGDKVPRKGGPGITQSDLFVINKIDLADAVGAVSSQALANFWRWNAFRFVSVAHTRCRLPFALVIMQDLAVMRRDSLLMRGDGPTVFAQVKHGVGVDDIVKYILSDHKRMVDACKDVAVKRQRT
eukprot:TRINITY_DN625_c0_g1_i4.p1 TRINITY_DN625_c0_g1~~TRINITY_DN625_c0_g1_i4.p1  ORF type:complete len:151 (+),score=22.74 TRINITY_DN625_c0_g1_i4:1361-1813(+)